MKLGTHMPDGERRKPIDIEVCRSAYVYQVSFRSYILFLRYRAETKKYQICVLFLEVGESLSILRFVEQRSRSPLLKIEEKK
jgi:hypothetical protein